MYSVNQVQILDDTVCISQNLNNLKKGTNIGIFPRAVV